MKFLQNIKLVSLDQSIEVFEWSKDNKFELLELLSFKYRTGYWPNYIAILSIFEHKKGVQLQLAFAVCSLLFAIPQLI